MMIELPDEMASALLKLLLEAGTQFPKREAVSASAGFKIGDRVNFPNTNPYDLPGTVVYVDGENIDVDWGLGSAPTYSPSELVKVNV